MLSVGITRIVPPWYRILCGSVLIVIIGAILFLLCKKLFRTDLSRAIFIGCLLISASIFVLCRILMSAMY